MEKTIEKKLFQQISNPETAPVRKKTLSQTERPFDDRVLRQKKDHYRAVDECRQDEIRERLGIPQKRKRFELNSEDFARERYFSIKKTVVEMKKEHPEVLSFCMYGSMSKGEAKEGSDIDGYLFVDAERIKNSSNVDPVETGSDYRDRNDAPSSRKAYARLTQDTEHFYLNNFKENIRKSTKLSDEQLRDIRVLPISRKIIDMQVDELRKSLENPEKIMRKFPSFLDENEMTEVEEEVITHVGDNLSHMFHLDVGGGIRGHRTYLLEKLNDMGEIGERIWHEIVDSTATMEHFSLSAARYPETLKDARGVYGLQIN